ncbi:MAG: transposase [Deltaproteobacteria bacterium]|nr:transposase [Deltaproteobacteria bacterium]
MPRKSRIDVPGALHHIICRGIERRKIFRNSTDKDDFINRLSLVLIETNTPCYAWALLSNHLHLLLRTGNAPMATIMRRVLTGYVVSFNCRYRRNGHLFQNRYKSILCQEDGYLLELVRYIHLNPLRAKLVGSIRQLDAYAYCGHSVLMGKRKAEWQDANKVLGLFNRKAHVARNRYRDFVIKGVELGRRPDLIGGGLIRSAGGWQAVKALGKNKIHLKGDERILGDSDFVLKVLDEQNECMVQRYHVREQGYDLEKIIERVSDLFSLSKRDILDPSRQRQRVMARSVLCYWAIRELGMSGRELAHILEAIVPSVSRAVSRGREQAQKGRIKMIDN